MQICSPTEYTTSYAARRPTVMVWAVILDHQHTFALFTWEKVFHNKSAPDICIACLEPSGCVRTATVPVCLAQISSSQPLPNGQATIVNPTGVLTVCGQLAPSNALVVKQLGIKQPPSGLNL